MSKTNTAPTVPVWASLAVARARAAPLGSNPWTGDAPATMAPAKPGPDADIAALLGIDLGTDEDEDGRDLCRFSF